MSIVKSCRLRSTLLSILALFVSAACIPKATSPDYIAPSLPVGKELKHTQEMLALSMVSYTGELLKGSDSEVESILAPCLVRVLEEQPLTQGRWNIVWGPAVYKFSLATLDDNLMFVVNDSQNPENYVIVIRGTNGKAILDWIKEDLEVATTLPWSYGNPPEGLKPRISKSTSLGLGILQNLRPSKGILGEGQSIDEFLTELTLTTSEAELTIYVTGHSLAGALSPTLTLWLADTQKTWDKQSKATLAVYAFAGPTAGNADFASYSDSRIGDATHRFHNPYDIVPKAWNIGSLEQIPNLYESIFKFPIALKLLLDVFVLKVDTIHYTQIQADVAPIPGVLNPDKKTFAGQAGWQHVCGYQCGLDIQKSFKPIPLECTQQADGFACTRCPD